MATTFQQRHYIAIAKVMAETKPSSNDIVRCYQWEHTMHGLCNMFDDDNPKFDIVKFMDACTDRPREAKA